MKKILVVALALIMTAFVFASCAPGNDVELEIVETAYITENYAIAISKENTELLEQVDNALLELIEDGTVKKIVDKYISGEEHDLVFQENTDGLDELVMGTNAEFPPYEFKVENEKIVGIDAEVAAAIADKIGRKLRIEDMAFDGLIPALSSGRIEMIMAGMTVTEERKEAVNFSTSYATGVQVVIIKKDSGITVEKLFELKEDGSKWKIGVQLGTTGDLYATWDLAGEDSTLTAVVEQYTKGADAVQALISGKVDCVIIDNEPAKNFVAVNNNK